MHQTDLASVAVQFLLSATVIGVAIAILLEGKHRQ